MIASPDDSKKPIYALPSVNAALVETYFNWQAWPNFADRGKAPQLKKYPHRRTWRPASRRRCRTRR